MDCTICNDDKIDTKTMGSCGHTFHARCIAKYLRGKRTQDELKRTSNIQRKSIHNSCV